MQFRAIFFFGLIGVACLPLACDSKQKAYRFGEAPSEARLAEASSSLPKEGELVPDFILEDRQGRAFQLSQFKGNFVFLNFWATWCPPCIEELPSMDALNGRWKTKAFSMLAVSVDDSWEPIDGFMSRLNREPSFLILHDPGKLVATGLYGVEKFPESFLIGPDRRLLKKYQGAFRWDDPKMLAEISALMEENAKK